MGMYADSVVYIMGARNILGGNGYTYFSGTDVYKLITIWPPLYSYILAGIGLTGLDIIRATRLLNIALMGIDLLVFAGLNLLSNPEQIAEHPRRSFIPVFGAIVLALHMGIDRAAFFYPFTGKYHPLLWVRAHVGVSVGWWHWD